MRLLNFTPVILVGLLLTVPAAAQITEEGFAIHDGMVIGKWIEDGHVVLELFGTSGDGILEVLCPLAQSGALLADAADMFEVGDIASMWDGLPPDQTSDFPTLHRLTSVTIGQHARRFAIHHGEVIGKWIEGSHVVLDLLDGSDDSSLQVICPMSQPGDMLAETCEMVEIGDVAYLWDGLAPDQTSDFPTLHVLTSVTIGTPTFSTKIFADGFESGDTLAWSLST